MNLDLPPLSATCLPCADALHHTARPLGTRCRLYKVLPDLIGVVPHLVHGLFLGSSPIPFKPKFFKKWLAFAVSLLSVPSDLRLDLVFLRCW